MNYLKLLTAAIPALGMSLSVQAESYTVTAGLSEDEDGAMAYLINYDSGDKIDSVNVSDQKAIFQGDIKDAALVRLIIDGQRHGQFILEPGNIAYDSKTHSASGTQLNDALNSFEARVQTIAKQYRSASTEAQRDSILNAYDSLTDNIIKENSNNPIGYMLFINKAYNMSPEQFEASLQTYPEFKKYKRVEKLIQAQKNMAATQPGNMFTDFEIEYDGVKHRLSDVVGKGDYVLVDFWASWCGPCIRQTAVIKDIYKEYKDKGLKVLGVAVWDEPDKTKEAIRTHDLPWECWLNGQNIPTDLYGISGIPCIILFGPDGTILSRDKQDDALKADVRTALQK